MLGVGLGARLSVTVEPALVKICETEPSRQFSRHGGMALSKTESKNKEERNFLAFQTG